MAAVVAEFFAAPFDAFVKSPKPQIPADLDHNSPFALFSLFSMKEMYETIATNTNVYT